MSLVSQEPVLQRWPSSSGIWALEIVEMLDWRTVANFERDMLTLG